MFEELLNLLLPQRPLVRELLRMEPAEFRGRARRSEAQTNRHTLSLFDYRDPLVREAVWMLKYRGNKRVARLLAELVYEDLLAFLEEYGTLTNFTDPLLLPIPLSKERQRKRGFNQCELLTDALQALDGNRNFSVRKETLLKIKDTQSQTKTESKRARLLNLRGCFAVAEPSSVANRNIILIDDVATTGATLEEARKTLIASGAKNVLAFTIAH